MSVIEIGKNSSPFILMQGTLEKLKEREFPWIFSGKKFFTTWVLRYYVLKHADVPDQEAFLLEQHEDCTPFSKVRKTLDLRYVLQIDTNISLKVGNQNWVLAIHYKAKHSERLEVLYLAAHSETEMNMWIMKLGYACKLRKQDGDDHQLVAGCVNNRCFTDSSKVETPTVSNIITNNTNCTGSVTTHTYIRLKDCSSTRSLGSSSASLNSSIASSSTLSENLPFKNSFLIPPPIPPKPSHSLRTQKGEKQIFESGRCALDQPLIPADVHEILTVKEEEWSNETVHPGVVGSIDAERTFLSSDSSLMPTVSNSSAPKPHPRRRNFHNIPPEVNRSCKPTGIKCIAINTGREKSSADDWKKEVPMTSSRFLSTIPLHQQSVHAAALQNRQILISQEALYGTESMRMTNGMLDYLDPVKEPLVQAQPFIKSSQRPKISCAIEYTQIDEESTKAVLKANVRQDEMRRNGFSV
ncbi:hypothetical protein ACH3XW_39415 [Acanthocheilonema viteae]|uniref:PH domain-containing protein n=1 Tax=Acanthocheilonema viteae TaxID=6277 RepID=A0A498SJY7_ACAVI|nr:unnamed protein product [Acanthocheilonema viteae]